MNGLRTLGGPLVVAAIVAIVYSCLPLGTAVEFGGDEGFELMKGLLCSKGYKLYSEIWSDQPPVLSLLLASSFKHWGADIRVARLMAAGFGLLLFASFYRLVNWRSGAWAAFPAVFLLVPAPGVLELSVSVMQEVPAFATALVAVWLLFHWRDRRHWGWLLASGAAFGLALEIKLTAGLIVPAIAMEIFLSHFSHRTTSWKQSGSCLLYWGTAGVAAFAVIGLIWGGGSFQSAWRAHATARDVQGLERPEDLVFPVKLLLDHAECVGMAIAGMALAAGKRRWRELAFPIAFLFTALAIHVVHRPWWTYYYLHLAIPMAWLAGFAVSQLLLIVSRCVNDGRYHPASPKTWKAVVLCTLIGVVVVRSEGRLQNGILGLHRRERADKSPIVAKMKHYADRTHWVYAHDGIYAFHAGLLMPPELAVVTLKRFWSGQISTPQIVDICRRYGTEQLVLEPRKIDTTWKEFLTTYSVAYTDGNLLLYVANESEHDELKRKR